ncbi:MAG TPA: cytochrome c [Tahibacter sp.]|nr:cytochrome c [Tahibacter sp.]
MDSRNPGRATTALPTEAMEVDVIKRMVLGLLGLIAAAVVGLLILAYRPAIDPIEPPSATTFSPALVAQGEVLAGAGYCATCHTAKGGAAYAGGYAMKTGFGTIYSTNITPDAATGIGRWSEEAFRRAMRQGVARDGSHLFPAFPYQHFNQVGDDDLKALYAYLMTREPIAAPPREPDIPFPLNRRVLQAGWKLLFFRNDAYGPITGGTPEWNRGAYLAEGLSHCSACHSPRNGLGAEKTGADERYAGAAIDDWYAPPLSAANRAPVAWTKDELFAYLRTGATALHGVAAGPMSPVVHDGLSKLPDADVMAIATYFADRFGATGERAAPDAALAKVLAASAGGGGPVDHGANLYDAACASCHYNSGPMPLLVRPELGLNSALTASDPSSLIQVILHGVAVDEGLPGAMMPGFAQSLSDTDIAQLASWLRRSRTDQPPWPDLDRQVAALRAQSESSRSTH